MSFKKEYLKSFYLKKLIANNRWVSLSNVMITLTVLSVILISILSFTWNQEKLIDNKQDVSVAWGNSITLASQYLAWTGSIDFLPDTISWTATSSWYDLNEDKQLDVWFNKSIFWASSTWMLQITYDSLTNQSYLWVDVNWGNKNIPSYSFDNGIIIDDASFWTPTQRGVYKTTQLDYIKAWNYWSGAQFVSDTLANLNTAGSFVILDLGKKVSVNTFDFWYTQNVATASPKVISLTFDDGTRYNFSIDTSKATQKLSFMDTKTRFIKLDIVATNDGEWSLSNTVLAWVTNIVTSNVNIDTSDSTKITVTFPSLVSADIKYYNIYFASWSTVPSAPALIIPQKSWTVTVYYNNLTANSLRPNNLWIEPCVMEWICKDKINKSF